MRRTLSKIIGRAAAPLFVALVVGASLVTAPATTAPEAVDLPETQRILGVQGQVHYLPWDAAQFLTMAQSQNGSTTNSVSPVRLITSIVSALEGNQVAIDHWEDGYDLDPVNDPQGTTEVFTLDEGANRILSNDVDTSNLGGLNGRGTNQPWYDGGDKLVSTGALVVSAGGWPSGAGTLHAGASAVPNVANYGYDFVAPTGDDVTDFGSLWDYSGLVIVASEDATTVDVAGSTVTLDEGDSHLVDGGIQIGETVSADKPVAVYLTTGDPSANYEGRLYNLTPTERWSNSYMTPVGSRSGGGNKSRVFFYNPSGSAITVTATPSSGAATSVSVPANGQANYLMPDNTGAAFTSSSPFYAIEATTTPESGSGNDQSSAYNWGIALIPTEALTPMVVVGYGPGSNDTGTPGVDANDSAVWVAPVSDATIYVDLDADPSTGALTDPNGNRYDFTCPGTAGTPVLIKDVGSASCSTISAYTRTGGTGDNDMTGSRIYTTTGVSLAAAWGQVPGAANTGSPAIDMGTTVLPFPTIDLDKSSEVLNDDGDGKAVPGDTIRFTVTITNRGISPVDDLTVNDVVPENTSYVEDSTTAAGNPITDPATGTPFPLDEGGLLVPPVLGVGETRTVTYDLLVDDPLPTGVESIVNEITLESDYGTYKDREETPVPVPGSVGDRVWDDGDGDGVQDGGESGLVGLTVELVDDGGDVVATTTTGADGAYTFTQVYPGTYTVRVVASSLPEGYGPTFDLDGVGTAHEATVTVAEDQDRTDVDFGYQVQPALEVEKTVYAGHDGGAGCATGGTELVEGEDGDPVTWCFRVTNTGGATLTGITLDDGDLGITQGDTTGVSGSLASLAPGASVVRAYAGTIEGDLENTVTAEGTAGTRSVSDTDTAAVNLLAPAISLVKTVYRGHDGGAGCGTAGDSVTARDGGPVTYCFEVTNTGDTNLSAVTFSDPDLGVVDGDQVHGLLTPGQSHTFHVEATVAGDLLNTATARGTSPAGVQPTDTDTASVDAINPSLTVDKTVYVGHDAGAGCDTAGETVGVLSGTDITWCLHVVNTGDVALTDLTIEDLPLLADETDFTVPGGLPGSIPVGGEVDLYLQATATDDLTNTAVASATPPLGADVSDEDDASVDVVAPSIALDKAVYLGTDGGAGCDTAGASVSGPVDQPVTWCFTITNDGDVNLADIGLEDLDLGFDETDPEVQVLSGDLASLPAGDSIVLFVEGMIAGDLENTATATGTPPVGPDVSDQDTATVEQLEPGLDLQKTVYAGHDGGASCQGLESLQGRAGDPVTWCFRVENTGELDLEVQLRDPAVGLSEDVTLPVGDVQTFHVEGEVDGDLVNTATVTGIPPYGPPVPVEDEAEVDEIHPSIEVRNTIYAGHDSGAGCEGVESLTRRVDDAVTWCFVVVNAGDVDLDDIRLEDLPLGVDQTDLTELSGDLDSLPVGQSMVLYLQRQATVDVANEVTATGTPPVGPDVTDDDTAALEVIDPSVTIEKTVYAGHDGGASCAGDELVQAVPGDDITYCFTVTNATGHGPLTDLRIDDLPLGVDQSDLVLVTGPVSPLADGASATWILETQVDGDLLNTATVTGTPTVGPDVEDEDTAEVDEVNADIAIDKTVVLGWDDGADCGAAVNYVEDEDGQPVTWCFTVTNTGDATLTDVLVDDLDLGVDQDDLVRLSGSLDSLDPDESVVLYWEGVLDGDLTNLAATTATPPVGPAPKDADSATVHVLVPDVAIEKTVYRGHDGGASCPGADSVIAREGDAVTWCFEVTNPGEVDLTVRVTDPLVGLDETFALAAGDSATLHVEGTVTADILNTGSADGDTPDGDEVEADDTAEVDVVHPDIELDKTVYEGHDGGAGCPGGESHANEAGHAVTWCFEITNTGDTALIDLTVEDLPLGVDEGDLTPVSGSLGMVPAGGTVVLAFEDTIVSDLQNTATVTGTPPVGPDVSDDNDASVDLLVPDVRIDKSVYRGHDGGAACEGGESVVGQAGDEITWCFLVVNTGEVALEVTVEDPQIGFTDLVSLAPGEDELLFVEDTIDGDLVPNVATATGETPDGDEVPDEDTAEVDEIHPAIHVEKTVYPGHDGGASCEGGEDVEAEVGDAVTWCFVITNPGDVDLVDIRALDPELGDLTQADLTLDSGSWATLPTGGTITAFYEDVITTETDNTVTVRGTAPDDSEPVDADTASVAVIGPDIGVAKTIVDGPTSLGDGSYALTYRIRVENSGETRLDDIQLTDDLSATFGRAAAFEVVDVASDDLSVNWPGYTGRPSGSIELLDGTDSLAVSDRADLEVSVIVTPGAFLGPYENTAIASGTSPAGEDVEDTSDSGSNSDPGNPNPGEPGDTNGTDDPVPVEFPTVDLVITKGVESTNVVGNIGTAVWRIQAGNNGPGDEPGPVTVTDELDDRLQFVSAEGDGWNCGNVGQVVTCTWDAPLAAGEVTTPIRVVTETVITGDEDIANGAHVSGTGGESRTDNNDAAAEITTFVDEVEVPSTLPRTGASIAGLVLAGLALVLGGRYLQRRAQVAGA